MKIGVTGTRSGMTRKQIEYATHLLTYYFEKGSEFHHGDCIGADVETAKIAKSLGYKIVCHPPIKHDLRAFYPADEMNEELPYLKRNRNIVQQSEVLLAIPRYMTRSRGGTWYTHDYAVKNRTKVELILPE
mgnify:CR=1 FL=1